MLVVVVVDRCCLRKQSGGTRGVDVAQVCSGSSRYEHQRLDRGILMMMVVVMVR